jgi:O-antigen/teichoic acid export membrane protein
MKGRAENADEERRLKTVTKGAGLVFAGMVISKVLTYFYRLVVAKYYGPDYYGLISIGLSVITLLAAAILLGLDSGVVRFAAFYAGKGDLKRARGAILTPFRVCVPIAIAAAALLWVFAPQVAGMFSVGPELAGYLESIFRIFSVSIPFYVAYALIMAANKGMQKIKYNVYADYIFFSIVQVVLVVSFFLLGFDVTGVAISYTAAVVLSFLFVLLLFRRAGFAGLSSVKSIFNTRKMAAYSLPIAAGSFAAVAITYLDTIFLGVFRTASETGVYNAALPTANFILVFATAFGALFFPIMTELYSRKNVREMETFYRTVTNWIFVTTLPFALTFIMFSDKILLLLFGQEYVQGAAALSILTVTFFMNAIFTTSVFMLLVLGKTRYTMINVIAAALIVFFGNMMFTPAYGSLGAASVSAFSAVFAGTLVFLEVRRFAKITPFSGRVMIKSFAAGATSIAFVYFLYKLLQLQSSFILMALLFLLFILVYFILLLLLRSFGRNDIMMMSAIEKKLGVRSRLLRSLIKRFIR